MRTNVVHEAALYLECSHKLIFAFAFIYSGYAPTREALDAEYGRWKRRTIIPEFVGDFCLDLLTGKVRVDIDERNATWSVVKIKRKQLEGGKDERKT